MSPARNDHAWHTERLRTATASPILVDRPPPVGRRPYVRRLLLVAALFAAALIVVIVVDQRRLDPHGIGASLYWLHDHVFLWLKGQLWTALFPVGTFAWLAAAVVLLAGTLSSYLLGVDPIRALQARVIRGLCKRTNGTALLLGTLRLGTAIGLRGDFLRSLVKDEFGLLLEKLRIHVRGGQEVPPALLSQIYRGIDRIAALAELDSSEGRASSECLAALLLALRAGPRDAEQSTALHARLARSIQMPVLRNVLDLALSDGRSAERDTGIAALRRETARLIDLEHHLAYLLDRGDRPFASQAITTEPLETLLFCAITLGLAASDSEISLGIALEAIASVERAALADTLRNGDPLPRTEAAAASLALTDARLHAAAIAARIEELSAPRSASWEGIVANPAASRALELAIAAARE
jgi:hypothetical protein